MLTSFHNEILDVPLPRRTILGFVDQIVRNIYSLLALFADFILRSYVVVVTRRYEARSAYSFIAHPFHSS